MNIAITIVAMLTLPNRICTASVVLLVIFAVTCSVSGDSPTTQSTAASLFSGRVEFIPPENWTLTQGNVHSEMIAFYVADDHDGYFAIQVLPANATVKPEAIPKMIAQLTANHKKARQEIVEAPKGEKDDRFAISIHEKYKTAEGKIADELHLYREMNGRVLVLDIQTLSEDPAHVEVVHKAGQETLASARWVKPTPKKK